MKLILLLVLCAIIFLVFRQFTKSRKDSGNPIRALPENLGTAQTQGETENPDTVSEQSLEPYRQRAKENSLSAIRITPEAKTPDSNTDSKIGGLPWWPIDKEIPSNSVGEALSLLVQINLSDLPKNDLLPVTGLLQFFIGDDDLYGLEFSSEDQSQQEINQKQKGYRVVLHETTTGDSIDSSALPRLEAGEYSPIGGEYAMQFEKFEDPASPIDYRWQKISADLPTQHADIEDELYDDLTSGGSKIGGYAYFTQEDPRGYSDSPEPDVEWLLLLQIDTASEEDVEIMWGDSGVANFFIRKDHLARNDFSEVWYNWDCC